MNHEFENPPLIRKILPWSDSKQTIWLATELVLRRNIDPFLFPCKMEDAELSEVSEIILDSFQGQNDFSFHKAEDITLHQKEFIYEHFFLSEGYEKVNSGRYLAMNENDHLLALINFEDHIHLHKFHFGENIKESSKTLEAIEKKLAKKTPFCFSERFGYLTSDPTMSGTGLRVRAFLHLPLLIHLSEFSEMLETMPSELEVKGLGINDEYLGDIVIISNKYSLGVTEEIILKSIETFSKKLEKKESELRESLSGENKEKIKDRISRSFGILKNSYQIESSEALSLLSLISLGVDLKWINDHSTFSFSDLLFSTRRAHLKELLKCEQAKTEKIAKIRASYLREKLLNLDETNIYKDAA